VKFKEMSEEYNVLHSQLTKHNPNDDDVSYEVLSFGWYTLGYTDFYKNDVIDAIDKFNISLRIDKEKGNHGGIADNLYMLGKCAEKNYELRNAVNYYERALEIYKVLKNEETVFELKNRISSLKNH
jgi:tetratricopeptide (TPR) repeat protein